LLQDIRAWRCLAIRRIEALSDAVHGAGLEATQMMLEAAARHTFSPERCPPPRAARSMYAGRSDRALRSGRETSQTWTSALRPFQSLMTTFKVPDFELVG
jgi:hypothetical protein